MNADDAQRGLRLPGPDAREVHAGHDAAAFAVGAVPQRGVAAGFATAFISVGHKTYTALTNLSVIFEQVARPRQTGDVLYGVTQVAISQGTLSGGRTTNRPASVEAILRTIGPIITRGHSGPIVPCTQKRTLTFYRGDDRIGSLTTRCSTIGTPYLAEFYEGRNDLGTISFDMTKFTEVESLLP